MGGTLGIQGKKAVTHYFELGKILGPFKEYIPLQFNDCHHRNDKKFDMALTGVMHGCAWCEEPKENWGDPATIKKGFKLTRSLEGLNKLWRSLDKNKAGQLIRREGDYSVRKGLCHKPVTTRELFHFTVCHKV